jgi:hypothetical protein
MIFLPQLQEQIKSIQVSLLDPFTLNGSRNVLFLCMLGGLQLSEHCAANTVPLQQLHLISRPHSEATAKALLVSPSTPTSSDTYITSL